MKNSRRTLIKARLTIVRRDLDEILERLSPGLLNWAPRDGMRTIAGQLIEITITEIELISALKTGEVLSDAQAMKQIEEIDRLDGLISAARDVRDSTLKYIDSLSEDELIEEVEFSGGWFGALGLPTIPRAEVFLSIADHEWYHVGQLTSYLWSRGDDPYEW